MSELRILLLSDGKMGDIVPLRGVAKRLEKNRTCEIVEHVIKKGVLNFLPAQFGITQSEDEKIFQSELPHVVLASSWRTLPYLKRFKKLRGGDKYPRLVFFKNPRQMYNVPDLIWLPEHDKVSGKNIFSTLTSPHPFCVAEIKRAKERGAVRFGPWCKEDGTAPVGIILGGNTRWARWGHKQCFAFMNCLSNLPGGENIIVVPSRRTPNNLLSSVKVLASERKFYVWQGEGDNPYAEALAFCSRLIVTGDSHNMVSECVAMGKSVYVWRDKNLSAKLKYFLSELAKKNLISIIDIKNHCDWDWQNESALDCGDEIASRVASLL